MLNPESGIYRTAGLGVLKKNYWPLIRPVGNYCPGSVKGMDVP